jgi:hypothetical protein
MTTAKRLYVYFVAAVGLVLLFNGASIMLRLLVDQGGSGTSAAFMRPGYDTNKEALSLAISFVVVGLPMWLIHWGYAERMVRRDGPEGAAERRSIVRSVYLGLVLVASLASATTSLADLLRESICNPLGAGLPWSTVDLAGSFAGAVIGTTSWAYHAWVRARDVRTGPLIRGAAAWFSRLYLYGAIYAGLVAVLSATVSLMGTVTDAVAGYAQTFAGYDYTSMNVPAPTAAWWVRPVVSSLVAAAIGGALLAGHWMYAGRLRGGDSEQSAAERISRTRQTYFMAVVLTCASYAALTVAQSLGAVLGSIAGAQSSAGLEPLWRTGVVPIMPALLFTVVWLWHRGRAIREASDDAAAPSPRRVADYLVSFLGLVYFAVAAVQLVGLLLDRVMGSTRLFASLDNWRWQASQAIALAAVFASIWLWSWLACQRRLRVQGLTETRSSARRAYLFLVAGATIVPGAASVAFILYRFVRIGVGLEAGSLGSDLSFPLATMLVTAPLLAYHALAIRRDSPLGGAVVVPVVTAAAAAAAAPGALAAASVPAPVAEIPAMQELVIDAPPGADLEALKTALAERLPAGYSIRVRPANGHAPLRPEGR